MDLPSTDSIKSIGLNYSRCRTTLLGPYSLIVTMRVMEQWWEESTPGSPRLPGSLLSVRTPAQLYVLRKVGEVVYSLAEKKTDISTLSGRQVS